MSLALGGYGAISGATSARTAQASTMAIPMVAGVDSASAATRRRRHRAHAREAAGDDAESLPAATGLLMATPGCAGRAARRARRRDVCGDGQADRDQRAR